ncbi:hypothetical protein NAT51_08530 [Flavobacterium amniphilum]|uniref:M949_RS01915 family surface polysaccharide biosynthesis protein n=1 Tax=Flavobacterium amniphilum TaxID=1834035 RepID=UPI00202A42CE|nr:hypothetical protein [Flavobacterium amniphilum]MCL9805566.1 hypothetical protein [Flavobacterium amniphilum]
MLKRLFIIVTILFSINTFGQKRIAVQKLDKTKFPKGIAFEGKIKEALRWTDKLGDNIVITTETGIYQSKKFKHESEGSDAELFAYHFVISKDKVKQIWKVYDFISDCPVDIEAAFIENTFQVTDLNNDGIAEIWLMYRKVCHGDISPAEMKIIMYQGQQKFAMRGEAKVRVSETEFIGGQYEFDKAFIAGPAAFRDFAKKVWNKNIM